MCAEIKISKVGRNGNYRKTPTPIIESTVFDPLFRFMVISSKVKIKFSMLEDTLLHKINQIAAFL